MTEQGDIINRLLDKYENSRHLSDPGTSPRRVMLKVEKRDLPAYIYEDAVIRDAYNEAALELEKKHLVQLEWVKGRPVLSAIVLVALLLSVVPLLQSLPGLLTHGNSVEVREFLERALDIVIGIEFIKMLAKHSPGSVLEVLLYAIARHMIVGHEDAVQNLVSVGAIALIFIIRKFFFVPSFGHKMPGGDLAPDIKEKEKEEE